MVNVLQSRVITDNLGALSNVYNNNSYTNPDPVKRDPMVENEDGTYTIPTYERTVIDIPDDYDWTQYGEAGNALRYFNQIRTGEITYDPSKDVIDVDALTETDPNAPPLTDEAEMIKQEMIGVATQLAAGLGAQIGRSVAANAGDDGFQMGDLAPGFDDFKSNFNFGKMGGDIFRAPETGPASEVKFSPLSDNAEIAKKTLEYDKIIADSKITLEDVGNTESIAAKKIAKNNYELNMLYLFSICIFSDIGGLIFGKFFKGKKLTKISPNKTVSGSIGSFILSLTLVPIFYYLLPKNFNNPFELIFLAIMVSFSCQIGDLFFSYLKRKAKVKDTGDLLPGHGGILDRIDGILFAIPIGTLLLKFLV